MVTPLPVQLAIIGAVRCTQCERELSNSGALRIHMWKAHGERGGNNIVGGFGEGGSQEESETNSRLEEHEQAKEGREKGREALGRDLATTSACIIASSPGDHAMEKKEHRKKMFFCPVRGCRRGDGGAPFPRLGQLKQHYGTVHSEKQHVCSRCSKGFGMKDAFLRHQVRSQWMLRTSVYFSILNCINNTHTHTHTHTHTLSLSLSLSHTHTHTENIYICFLL